MLFRSHVLAMLVTISKTKGERAQGRKVDIIKGIMVKCQGSEAKFIVRALQGKLRIGTAEQTVLVALAHSFALRGLGQTVTATETDMDEKMDEIIQEDVKEVQETEKDEKDDDATGENIN